MKKKPTEPLTRPHLIRADVSEYVRYTRALEAYCTQLEQELVSLSCALTSMIDAQSRARQEKLGMVMEIKEDVYQQGMEL